MSPYAVSVADVVGRFAMGAERRGILSGWLQYRQKLRDIGLTGGFQWLAGSFVEDRPQNAPPKDLDLIVFLERPLGFVSDAAFRGLVAPSQDLFDRFYTKPTYMLDVFAVELGVNQDFLVGFVKYWLQLFSHRRRSYTWKGLLEVRQEDAGDEASLLATLTSTPAGVQTW